MNNPVEVSWSENEKEFMRGTLLKIQQSKNVPEIARALAQVCRKKWEIMMMAQEKIDGKHQIRA